MQQKNWIRDFCCMNAMYWHSKTAAEECFLHSVIGLFCPFLAIRLTSSLASSSFCFNLAFSCSNFDNLSVCSSDDSSKCGFFSSSEINLGQPTTYKVASLFYYLNYQKRGLKNSQLILKFENAQVVMNEIWIHQAVRLPLTFPCVITDCNTWIRNVSGFLSSYKHEITSIKNWFLNDSSTSFSLSYKNTADLLPWFQSERCWLWFWARSPARRCRLPEMHPNWPNLRRLELRLIR